MGAHHTLAIWQDNDTAYVAELVSEDKMPMTLTVDMVKEARTRRATIWAVGTVDQNLAEWMSRTDQQKTTLAQEVFKAAGV